MRLKKASVQEQVEELYKSKADELPDLKTKEHFVDEAVKFFQYLLANNYVEEDLKVVTPVRDILGRFGLALALDFKLASASELNLYGSLAFSQTSQTVTFSIASASHYDFENQFYYLEVGWEPGSSIPDIVDVILNRLKYKICDQKI